jgi:hypothetical protein
MTRWAGHVARVRETRNLYKSSADKPEGKRSLGRRGYRWEDNIKVDLKEIVCEGVDWIHVAQGRVHCWALVNTA